MISMLIGLLAPVVGEKYAKAAAWALIIVAAIALFFGAKAIYDHSVISNHEAKVEASAAKADRKADQALEARKQADEDRRQYEADQLTEAVKNAPHAPNADPRRERDIAFHKCLSLQQRARENGLQPPRCV